jgi:two-component system cell cycle response regulator
MVNLDKEKFPGMKVLMVDDTSANLDILGHILKLSGLNVSVALDMKKAPETARIGKPDLILLSVNMPGVDGYEICEKLKKDDSTKDIPVILISVMDQIDDIVKGFTAGCADYIIKPFQEKEVLARIGTQSSLRKINNENQELIRELDFLSRIDPLTRLSNRKDIIEKLKYEQTKFGRYGRDFSVILGDLDGFKKINEQFGNDAGDSVLKEIVEILKKSARSVDNLGRWGGNEFLIILAETNLAGSERLAEKIKDAINTHKFEFDNNTLQVAMSFGMACYTKKDDKIEELLKAADHRLCEAREQGRSFMLSA